MNERDEFRLPLALEQELAEPMKLELPSAPVMARRAIVMSRKPQLSSIEWPLFAIGAVSGVFAIIELAWNWWSRLRFNIVIPESISVPLIQAWYLVTDGYTPILTLLAMVGISIFVVYRGRRRTLSERSVHNLHS